MNEKDNDDLLEALKKMYMQKKEACPSCGRCPTCGHAGAVVRPHRDYPYWEYRHEGTNPYRATWAGDIVLC